MTIWQSLDWLLQSVHLAPRVHSAEFHLKSTREKRSQTLAGCKGALAHTAASGAAPSASEARRCASAGASSGSPSGGAGAPSGAGAAGATDADVVVEGGEGAVTLLSGAFLACIWLDTLEVLYPVPLIGPAEACWEPLRLVIYGVRVYTARRIYAYTRVYTAAAACVRLYTAVCLFGFAVVTFRAVLLKTYWSASAALPPHATPIKLPRGAQLRRQRARFLGSARNAQAARAHTCTCRL